MRTLLTEEIQAELESVKSMELGTKEYEVVIKGLSTLIDKAIELDKFDADCRKLDMQARKEELEKEQKENEREDRLDIEAKKLAQAETDRQDRLNLQSKQLELQQEQFELQMVQHNENKKNNALQILVAIGTTLLTVGLTVWGTNTTLNFEKEGTVTTSAGRGFIAKLFSKR